MICNPTVDEKIIISVKLIVKANKNKKIQQRHKIHAPWTCKTLNKYNITTNGTIPAEIQKSDQERQ